MVHIDDLSKIKSLSNFLPLEGSCYFNVNSADLHRDRYKQRLYSFQKPHLQMTLHDACDDMVIVGQTSTHLLLTGADDQGGHALYAYRPVQGAPRKLFTSSSKIKKAQGLGQGQILLLISEYADQTKAFQTSQGQVTSSDCLLADTLPFSYNGRGRAPGYRDKLVRLEEGQAQALSVHDQALSVVDFVFAADQGLVYFVALEETGLGHENHQLFVYDPASGQIQSVYNQKRINYLLNLAYEEGKLVFTSNPGDRLGFGQSPYIVEYDCQTGSILRRVHVDRSVGSNEINSDLNLGSHKLFHLHAGQVYYAATDHYESKIYVLADQVPIQAVPFQGTVVDFTFVEGDLYFVGQRKGGLQEIYGLTDGQPVLLSQFNEAYLQSVQVSMPEHMSFETEGGLRLDGWVIPPMPCDPAETYPAILNIHGGPRTVYGQTYFHEMQYWAHLGYYVIYCNPRGSGGRGDDFADARRFRMALQPYQDLMTFVDHCLETYPAIDPANVMVTGGSYGGYMTNWIVGHTDRFRAAVSQRSISNWLSQTFETDVAHVSFRRFQESAEDLFSDVETLWELSPLKHAQAVNTPLLLVHACEDYRCPVSQAVQFYNALKILKKETALALFEGENHELSRSGKPSNRIARLALISRWFEDHRTDKPGSRSVES